MNYGQNEFDISVTYYMWEYGMSQEEAEIAEMEDLRRREAAGDEDAKRILRDLDEAAWLKENGCRIADDRPASATVWAEYIGRDPDTDGGL